MVAAPRPGCRLDDHAFRQRAKPNGERGEQAIHRKLGSVAGSDHYRIGRAHALEDVIVVGYPDGIVDPAHNIPVFRRGITATPASIDFGGKQEFLIDAAIFPGSSGSPVLLYNIGSYQNHGNLVIGSRVKLLGVIHAVMLNGINGQISIVPAPTQARAIVSSQMPNNLGMCLRSFRILEFEPLLVQMGFKPPEGYTMRAQSNQK